MTKQPILDSKEDVQHDDPLNDLIKAEEQEETTQQENLNDQESIPEVEPSIPPFIDEQILNAIAEYIAKGNYRLMQTVVIRLNRNLKAPTEKQAELMTKLTEKNMLRAYEKIKQYIPGFLQTNSWALEIVIVYGGIIGSNLIPLAPVVVENTDVKNENEQENVNGNNPIPSMN